MQLSPWLILKVGGKLLVGRILISYVNGIIVTRTDIKKGTTLLSDHFSRFGLKMYTDTEKNLKT